MNITEVWRKQIQHNGAMMILAHGKHTRATPSAIKKDFFSHNGFGSVSLHEEDVKKILRHGYHYRKL